MRDWAHRPKAGDTSRRSWLCRSASAPSQQACEPVEDRSSGPCSRPRHAAGWRSRKRAAAGWVAWVTNAITEGRARFRIGTQWFSRSGCWNRRAGSGERAIAVESRIHKLSAPAGEGAPQGRMRDEMLVSRQPSTEGSTGPLADWPRQVSKEEKESATTGGAGGMRKAP